MKPRRSSGDAFLRVGGERGKDGRDGRIDAGIKDAACYVSDGGVGDLGVVAKIRGKKGEHAKDGEGHAQPEEPGPAFAPAAVGFVKDDAPDRGVHRIHAARNEQDVARHGGGDAIYIRIKLEQVERDHAKHQLPGGIAGGVTEAFGVGGAVHEKTRRFGQTGPAGGKPKAACGDV